LISDCEHKGCLQRQSFQPRGRSEDRISHQEHSMYAHTR